MKSAPLAASYRLAVVFVLMGWASTALLAQNNPVPLINQPLVPDAAAPGEPGLTLVVNGTGFVPGSVVSWNGSALSTHFVSDSQLTATVPASDVSAPGTASVTVANPGPGGGSSNVAFFAIATAASAVSFSASTVAVGQGPAALVAGDFNGDGKLDLAVANSAGASVSILLGNGGATFASPVNYVIGANASSIVAGDFNNDGKLDLVVGNSILLGNGDGTFQPYVALAIAGMVAADFNGDGNLDLAALAETSTGSPVISVALGNGDGTFRAAINSATMVQVGAVGSLSVNAGDFNGDGKLDLAVAGQFIDGEDSGGLFIQLGNGDGTFSLVAGLGVSGLSIFFNPTWVGLGDFNGDGKLDLGVTSCYTRDILAVSYPILLGQGDGNFTAAAGGTPPAGNFACPASGVLADFNGDGKLDLAAVNPPQLLPPGPDDNTVSILLGNGDGSLRTPVEFPTGSFPFSAAAGDFNGDGRLDLAVANDADNTVSIFLQQLVPADLSPDSLTFGPVNVGSTTAAQTISVSNVGSTALEITGISTTADFAETTNCSTSLASAATCTISVTFTPAVAGETTGTLTFSYSGAGSPQSVPLYGTGGGAMVALSTAALQFGYHEINVPSLPQMVTLTNTGSLPLAISSIAISYSLGNSGFTQTNTCGSSVAAGASCVISVTFDPPTAEPLVAANLNIMDNAAGGEQLVTLAGQPTATAVLVSPSSLAFGNQAVETTSAAQTITLANAGNTPLTLRKILSSPREFFQQTNTCPETLTLTPGTSCFILVTFKPASEGPRKGFLFIIDSSTPRHLQLVPLSGTGDSSGLVPRHGHPAFGGRGFRGARP